MLHMVNPPLDTVILPLIIEHERTKDQWRRGGNYIPISPGSPYNFPPSYSEYIPQPISNEPDDDPTDITHKYIVNR